MALPASGQISFNDLRVELGISSQAPFSITSAATNGYVTINTSSPSYPNSSTPHAISEWYSYNHTYSPCNTYANFATSGITSLTDCQVGSYPATVYSTCASLTTSCVVYQVTGCLSAFSNTFIQASDGTNYELNGSGAIIGINNPFC